MRYTRRGSHGNALCASSLRSAAEETAAQHLHKMDRQTFGAPCREIAAPERLRATAQLILVPTALEISGARLV